MAIGVIGYKEAGQDLEAYVAYPDKPKAPLVILCHAWGGRDDFICQKAREIAKLGYVAFALDMYGIGVLGRSREENMALKKPFIDDRSRLRARVVKAFEVASHLPMIDQKCIAVLGFGFGAICALDLARTGADLRGVITIYGHFDPPPLRLVKPIKAKVLVLHGALDPIANLAEVKRFEEAMEREGNKPRVILYEEAYHAFANPLANDLEKGLLYNPDAALCAWKEVENFLAQIFA